MNTQTQEALKMAIDWIEGWIGYYPSKDEALKACKEALASNSEALAQPAITDEKGRPMTYWGGLAQPSWQGLSDDEIDALKKMEMKTLSEEATEFARAIEQALKERNT